MTRVGICVVSAMLVAGCASSSGYRTAGGTTVTAARGQNSQQQAADTAACEQIAKDETNRGTETAKGAGVGAVGGALAGAAAGAAIGAATGGDVGKSAGIGAGVGAVGGAATGGGYKYSKSGDAYNANFASCMSNRGYSVTY
jgi:hypothetical protein